MVLGAGIVGLHVAAGLARQGAEVTVLERGVPGEGTSGASFAWIDASHPGVAPYLELRLLGLDAWQRHERELGAPSWLSLRGTITWVTSASAGEQLRAHVARIEKRGPAIERLTPAEAGRLEPELRIPADVEAVYLFRGEGWLSVRPAIAAVLERGAAAGVRLRRNAEVAELTLADDGRVTGVALRSGERVDADVVVSCVGRSTQPLLKPAGVEVPMVDAQAEGSPAVGLVVLTTPSAAALGTVVCADGVVVRPECGGRLLIHSDAHDVGIPGAVDPTRAAVDVLALVKQVLPRAAATSVLEARVCVRVLPIDLMPVVGLAREGLYVVATHSGVTLAPTLGELVARELIAGHDEEVLAPF